MVVEIKLQEVVRHILEPRFQELDEEVQEEVKPQEVLELIQELTDPSIQVEMLNLLVLEEEEVVDTMVVVVLVLQHLQPLEEVVVDLL